MYQGFCFLEDGTHSPAVNLDCMEAVFRYLRLQAPLQHRVIITDSDDYIIFEALGGKMVYPNSDILKTTL